MPPRWKGIPSTIFFLTSPNSSLDSVKLRLITAFQLKRASFPQYILFFIGLCQTLSQNSSEFQNIFLACLRVEGFQRGFKPLSFSSRLQRIPSLKSGAARHLQRVSNTITIIMIIIKHSHNHPHHYCHRRHLNKTAANIFNNVRFWFFLLWN